MFDDENYAQILKRINSLTPESTSEWGSMNLGQMLAHCAEVQEVGNGKNLVGTPFIVKLMKGYIRKMVVNDKPYPRNSKTHPQYTITEKKDFEKQKRRLTDALVELKNAGPVSRKHPIFGEMSGEERGWVSYKHLDHHLTQFRV